MNPGAAPGKVSVVYMSYLFEGNKGMREHRGRNVWSLATGYNKLVLKLHLHSP